ncbi:uncharacterized protein F5147DRAFT_759270 [Suillus discolor]|uniref:DhaK domain-containing protein n=1 Tax=Suillus discolor TaxID=1912936 RepID=A0A9P7JXJ4_9AGAM|nr:uncharacterized protein F5147DRAFT_759270 [Suillus discolor]KAG2113561.1 hypothetical protein F5147DRAFT_759270 [Suillus discolor]
MSAVAMSVECTSALQQCFSNESSDPLTSEQLIYQGALPSPPYNCVQQTHIISSDGLVCNSVGVYVATSSPLTQHPSSRDAFASPSANKNVAAIEFAAFANGPTHRDVVVVTNNYTGNRLKVVSVLNADDVLPVHQANQDTKAVLDAYTTPGGKGASRPSPTRSHAECLGDMLVAHLHSIGIAVGHCHVPGHELHPGLSLGIIYTHRHSVMLFNFTANSFQLVADGHVEVGLGLYIEPGVRRAPLARYRDVVPGGLYGGEWSRAEIYARYSNNLDGVSQLEIGAVVEEVRRVLALQKIVPSRVYCVPFMTSLSVPGFSISTTSVSMIHELIDSTSICMARKC